MAAEECSPAKVKTKLPVRAANEVQHGEAGLAVRPSQASTELLEEHQCALGRAEKQDGVDFGHVHPFVEEVDAEDHIDCAVSQIT
jgi:hypothetical protein